MSVSLDRLVRNQALFREVNERINEVVDHKAAPTEFVCECSRDDCTTAIGLTPDEYQSIRSQDTCFFVVPGHVTPEVERVVRQHDGYVVVQKTHAPELVTGEGEPGPREG